MELWQRFELAHVQLRSAAMLPIHRNKLPSEPTLVFIITHSCPYSRRGGFERGSAAGGFFPRRTGRPGCSSRRKGRGRSERQFANVGSTPLTPQGNRYPQISITKSGKNFNLLDVNAAHNDFSQLSGISRDYKK